MTLSARACVAFAAEKRKAMHLWIVVIIACVSTAAAFGATPAELVVRGATIHTVDETHPRATALAVAGGRFVAVGTDRDITAHIAPSTRVLDLKEKTIVPGFNDAHLHPRPL